MAAADALRTQIEDSEHELAEYDDLKKGLRSNFEAGSLDEFGEVITKARIARGWSQADLAETLGMEQQQVQRYERYDWQKISLWRLQEVVETLGIDVAIHAWFDEHEDQDVEPSQIMSSYGGLYHGAMSSLGLGIGETLSDFGVGVGEALSNVSITFGETLGDFSTGIGEIVGVLPTTISDNVNARTQTMFGAVHRKPQATPNAPQIYAPRTSTPGTLEYRSPKGTQKAPELAA